MACPPSLVSLDTTRSATPERPTNNLQHLLSLDRPRPHHPYVRDFAPHLGFHSRRPYRFRQPNYPNGLVRTHTPFPSLYEINQTKDALLIMFFLSLFRHRLVLALVFRSTRRSTTFPPPLRARTTCPRLSPRLRPRWRRSIKRRKSFPHANPSPPPHPK